MPTTSNFGWTTPADTDLVKDGAAAIRTLGNGIDTSFVDLKGGTTGQVLAKASNTDLDFTWASDATGIPATIFDAKGDLIAASAADTAARLAVGTNGQVLTADSTTATGLKWATAASGGAKSMTLLNAGGTSLTGSGTVTVSGISNQQALLIIIAGGSGSSASEEIYIRLNADSTSKYRYAGLYSDTASPYNLNAGALDTAFTIGTFSNNAASAIQASALIWGTNSTSGFMPATITAMPSQGGGTAANGRTYNGYYEASAAITSISVVLSGGNWDAGTLYVYGMAA